MQQNTHILKLFSKILLFFKLNFNKIELHVELIISNVDITNVEFYLNIYIYIYISDRGMAEA